MLKELAVLSFAMMGVEHERHISTHILRGSINRALMPQGGRTYLNLIDAIKVEPYLLPSGTDALSFDDSYRKPCVTVSLVMWKITKSRLCF